MSRRWLFGWLLIALILCLLGVWLTSEQFLKRPFALPESAKQEPWPVQSGLRIVTLRENIPTVNQVVVVPDEATFLNAIQEWSLQGRWPILIEDARYTPMFIRRFQPAKIIRVPKVQELLPQGQNLRQSMRDAVAMAWEAKDVESLRKKWRQLGWEPPGIVMTSENDPAWPASVALAAAWGQPLAFLYGNFGLANDRLTPQQWEQLKTSVQQGGETTGYPYSNQGDSIDTITIVRQMAVKYQSPEDLKKTLAVTDGLARKANGDRWAVVGWIYGSPARSVYQAMSSIFIEPETALLYDSYPPQDPWKEYEMNTPGVQLQNMGLKIKSVKRPESGVENWRSLTQSDFHFDLVWVNSKGNKDAFAVGNGNALVEDIPTLKFPAAVHFIHSFSATSPDDPNTVAGRWLENGAYVYVGSVDEPLLSAFIPPKVMVRRLLRSSPFLMAARQLESRAWKITTIGDPLMIIPQKKQRIQPTK